MSSWAAGRRSRSSVSASAMAESAGAGGAKAAAQAKRRVPLGNLTNVVGGRADAISSSTIMVADLKKMSIASLRNVNTERGSFTKSTSNQFDQAIPHGDTALQKELVCCPSLLTFVPSGANHDNSPGLSEGGDDMSICHSMENPVLDCLDDGDSVVSSLQHWADMASNWRKHGSNSLKIDTIADIDSNHDNPQLCATLAFDIYKHLREAETKRRPLTDFVETTQKDINTSMRAVLIDWLVEVTEEYRLEPETLYLTVNYIDRYLSGKVISKQRLQLLGVTCLLIAAKYEEICPPQVEELCYITDNTYTKDEVLRMEASILNYLEFEMTVPTIKCFLRRFIRAAQVCHEGSPTLHLEFLASYIAELSLLEYSLICYLPSLIAASCTFLAKFILKPTENPWNSTLRFYTQYQPSNLRDCVNVLHRIFFVGTGSNLRAIREKYSQHKYKFVAKKYCPSSIPAEFFQDPSS
ncbi:hypothetical protein GUJ93_ZPchr0005g15725 [Zizania palustris]|uniref:Cyclin N-terminal domain-containing protein n=1 Tax=Zizania palustris TaxID=103762 RepID=A0A8J5VCZ7_ZIZPA|nr:hypothetical protein GUJ93_ZPchr0005g15725 [Zizania palustris]